MLETGHRGMERGTGWLGTRDQTVLDWTHAHVHALDTRVRRSASDREPAVNAPGSWRLNAEKRFDVGSFKSHVPEALDPLTTPLLYPSRFTFRISSPFVPFEIERLLIANLPAPNSVRSLRLIGRTKEILSSFETIDREDQQRRSLDGEKREIEFLKMCKSVLRIRATTQWQVAAKSRGINWKVVHRGSGTPLASIPRDVVEWASIVPLSFFSTRLHAYIRPLSRRLHTQRTHARISFELISCVLLFSTNTLTFHACNYLSINCSNFFYIMRTFINARFNSHNFSSTNEIVS